MKGTYPVVISPAKEGGYSVYIPGWDINTQGETYEECLKMAQDVIGLAGIDREDDKKVFPPTVRIEDIKKKASDVLAVVDVDFFEYRIKNDKRSVKQNCTLPLWLQHEAKKKKINFSHTLQEALIKALGY